MVTPPRGAELTFGPSLKHCLQTARTAVHHYGKTRPMLVPVFVPRGMVEPTKRTVGFSLRFMMMVPLQMSAVTEGHDGRLR